MGLLPTTPEELGSISSGRNCNAPDAIPSRGKQVVSAYALCMNTPCHAASNGSAKETVRVLAVAAPSETRSNLSAQPSLAFENDETAADIIVEALISCGATTAFGIVGDGINSIIEALRKRRIAFAT